MSDEVVVVSTSRAGDAAYLATHDLVSVVDGLGVPYRLVGGIAVSLLVAVHGVTDLVPHRETADADLAAAPEVLADPRLLTALTELDYRRTAGNRLLRRVRRGDADLELAVDLLAPSYQDRLVPNQVLGDLVVDAVPGLSLALAAPAQPARLRVLLTDDDELRMTVALPDVVAALCVKALAWRGRLSERDATDIHRLLEAAHAAGIRSADWPLKGARLDAARVLHASFSRSRGIPARVRALVAAVVPKP